MLDGLPDLFHFGVPPAELIVRSVLVYALLLAALRLAGKREVGQFTLFDLAAVLLAANALQPAITGPDASIGGAVVILVTIFGANRVVAWARRRSPLVRRLLEVPATAIARDGAWLADALQAEGLDDDDLQAALREHGLEDIAQVKLATLEHDGSISVVPREGGSVRIHQRRRRYGRTRSAR
jgi:uncharacterized membrane protein YcaP (DUF421 family)